MATEVRQNPSGMIAGPFRFVRMENEESKSGSHLFSSDVAADVPTEAGLPGRPWSIPLTLQSRANCAGKQPIGGGLPFPRGLVTNPSHLVLLDDQGREVALQAQALAYWPDGSLQWLKVDFLAGGVTSGKSNYLLQQRRQPPSPSVEAGLHVYETEKGIVVDTGVAVFLLGRKIFQPFREIFVDGRDLLAAHGSRMLFASLNGRLAEPRIHRVVLEEKGRIRATLRFEGVFKGTCRPRFLARLCFFAGTGLVRLRLTLHNPNRAKHPGGLWDLGDSGSIYFRELALEVPLHELAAHGMIWTAETTGNWRAGPLADLEIYQESSGGRNWQSRNHVNRLGQIPLSFRGYRVRAAGEEQFDHRASPTVGIYGPAGSATVALPEFWQQFPKAITVRGRAVSVGLFPGQFEDGFELQGGERKTHTLWLNFSGERQPLSAGLSWVHDPAELIAPQEWYAKSGTLGPIAAGFKNAQDNLETLLTEATHGPRNFFERREIIDEFGWRHFGELYADHEEDYYVGPRPIISHYNNQYDCVLGALLQYLRTGDSAWWQTADPLARHVIDIDRYHTSKDKAAYNGGLFWFTDHFQSAATATHRTYSIANRPDNEQDYGGGPGSSHNFTTGQLLYYYLTGDPEARAAVIGLADWVVAMDEGRNNLLGVVDIGPTGLASATGLGDYHGPGRGAGNSINALLDGWIVTQKSVYLTKAEALIRRSIHPHDDIDARDLLNGEKRWSYTVFLVVLDRYLRLKADHGALDEMYAYSQESLVAYARWMMEREQPYLDHPERLQFPTKAWACQDLRKANVLRLAAAHAQEPGLRAALCHRGEALADRAWKDLSNSDSPAPTRTIALTMIEGLLDRALRAEPPSRAAHASESFNHGTPKAFTSQRNRVLQQLKSWRGRVTILFHLLNPYRWATASWRL